MWCSQALTEAAEAQSATAANLSGGAADMAILQQLTAGSSGSQRKITEHVAVGPTAVNDRF